MTKLIHSADLDSAEKIFTCIIRTFGFENTLPKFKESVDSIFKNTKFGAIRIKKSEKMVDLFCPRITVKLSKQGA